jgi:hypothetical protein
LAAKSYSYRVQPEIGNKAATQEDTYERIITMFAGQQDFNSHAISLFSMEINWRITSWHWEIQSVSV